MKRMMLRRERSNVSYVGKGKNHCSIVHYRNIHHLQVYKHSKVNSPLATWPHHNTAFTFITIWKLWWFPFVERKGRMWHPVMVCAAVCTSRTQWETALVLLLQSSWKIQSPRKRWAKYEEPCKTIHHFSAHLKAIKDVKTNHTTVYHC